MDIWLEMRLECGVVGLWRRCRLTWRGLVSGGMLTELVVKRNAGDSSPSSFCNDATSCSASRSTPRMGIVMVDACACWNLRCVCVDAKCTGHNVGIYRVLALLGEGIDLGSLSGLLCLDLCVG